MQRQNHVKVDWRWSEAPEYVFETNFSIVVGRAMNICQDFLNVASGVDSFNLNRPLNFDAPQYSFDNPIRSKNPRIITMVLE